MHLAKKCEFFFILYQQNLILGQKYGFSRVKKLVAIVQNTILSKQSVAANSGIIRVYRQKLHAILRFLKKKLRFDFADLFFQIFLNIFAHPKP